MSDVTATLAPHAWATLCEVRLRGTLHRPDPGHTGDLELMGLVVRRGDMVAITDAGRAAHAARARIIPGSAEEASVREVYLRFLRLNARLLRLCTDWQLRPGGIPNDHSDHEYDVRILDRLAGVLDCACAELNRLAAIDPRFDGYAERLDEALRRVDRGDHAWVASVTCDSVHTVWMLLHEELLCALGLTRADEQPVA
jgi:hypothetical protein